MPDVKGYIVDISGFIATHYFTHKLHTNIIQHSIINELFQIFLLFHQGNSIRLIARKLERSPSTFSRELNRNKEQATYPPSAAQEKYANGKAGKDFCYAYNS